MQKIHRMVIGTNFGVMQFLFSPGFIVSTLSRSKTEAAFFIQLGATKPRWSTKMAYGKYKRHFSLGKPASRIYRRYT
jgi:hypothetical protein